MLSRRALAPAIGLLCALAPCAHGGIADRFSNTPRQVSGLPSAATAELLAADIDLNLAVELRRIAPFRAATELLGCTEPAGALDARPSSSSSSNSLAMALSGLLGLGATQLGRAARRVGPGLESSWYHDGPFRQAGNGMPIDPSIATVALLPTEPCRHEPTVRMKAFDLPATTPSPSPFQPAHATRGPPRSR